VLRCFLGELAVERLIECVTVLDPCGVLHESWVVGEVRTPDDLAQATEEPLGPGTDREVGVGPPVHPDRGGEGEPGRIG
jgi:hypothetical protein